jgi:sphingolipid delta-4 desaturase
MVIVNFIRDKEVGIYARAKRLAKGSVAAAASTTKSAAGKKVVAEDEDSPLEDSNSDKSD